MSVKAIIWIIVCVQSLFLLFVLFEAPEPAGALKIAIQDLQSRDAGNGLPDDTKSTSGIIQRISSAVTAYGFQTKVSIFFTVTTLLLLIVLAIVIPAKRDSEGVPRGAAPQK